MDLIKEELSRNQQIELAKEVLSDNGICTATHWSVEDITSKYNCTDEVAMDVLDDVMNNDAYYSNFWEMIDVIADLHDLEEHMERVTIEEYENANDEIQWAVYGADGILIEDNNDTEQIAITWANENGYNTDPV
jgi:hypothetical protein